MTRSAVVGVSRESSEMRCDDEPRADCPKIFDARRNERIDQRALIIDTYHQAASHLIPLFHAAKAIQVIGSLGGSNTQEREWERRRR